MSRNKPSDDIPLVPFRELAANVRKVLAVSKPESDKHLASLHAANSVKRRAVKKKT